MPFVIVSLHTPLVVSGAGSVLQHLVAHGGNTQPPLFRAAMMSSTYLPSQYNYNDRIPEVILFTRSMSVGSECHYQMLYSEVVNGTLEVSLSLVYI